MFRFIETVATVILMLLVMMFVLHVLQGDSVEWIFSKFKIQPLTSHGTFGGGNSSGGSGAGGSF